MDCSGGLESYGRRRRRSVTEISATHRQEEEVQNQKNNIDIKSGGIEFKNQRAKIIQGKQIC